MTYRELYQQGVDSGDITPAIFDAYKTGTRNGLLINVAPPSGGASDGSLLCAMNLIKKDDAFTYVAFAGEACDVLTVVD